MDASMFNTLITANVRFGQLADARSLFGEMPIRNLGMEDLEGMKDKNVVPWSTMIKGLVMHDRGSNSLIHNGIKPKIEHYGCMVDLLARNGLLNVRIPVDKSLSPDKSRVYVLLANIYSVSGSPALAREISHLMREKGVEKTPGYSNVEIKGVIHEFIAGDRSHPRIKDIFTKWYEIDSTLRLEESY
ncbi:hypothetical protein ZWY2020_043884, partial [Hordeum vulgare]